jgi:hypothetical protein
MQTTASVQAVACPMAARPTMAKAGAFRTVRAAASIARPTFGATVSKGMKASRIESQRVVVVRAADDKVREGRNAGPPARLWGPV